VTAVRLQDVPTAHGWYTLEPDDVLAALDSTSQTGLSTEEAQLRLAQYGANVLVEGRRRSPLRILLAQFTDVMVLVLLGAAALAAFLGEPEDIVAILAIVVLNALLGFVQEFRAERAVAALKALAAPIARVRRDGVEVSIPAADLVPGDVVLLEAGVIVPADLRLLHVSSLRVDESALTGESIPVEKAATRIAHRDLPLADQRNMAYKGTTASYGRGTGIVVSSGMRTELGRIATLLGDAEGVRTPLQMRLARFGKIIAVVVFALCILLFIAGLLRGEDPVLMFMTALSLAVAAIPEALPAVVTVSLALGARHLIRQQALIRRLPAVETLGSVTYICSDKTGTLTENRMRVEAVQPADHVQTALSTQSMDAPLSLLFDAIALNNDARRGPDGEPVGDPTETALYRAAADAGHSKEALEAEHPRVAEIPFSSERFRMTTLHRYSPQLVAFTKGAPECVIPSCSDRLGMYGCEPLDREAALAHASTMAASGLRVLAVATRRLRNVPAPIEEAEAEQTLLGFVGLLDPPRPEAGEAVAHCHTAGIHVVMITGDHPATARAIAERLAIASPEDVVVTGTQLATMSQDELERLVKRIKVYARVAPEDKIRIVKALQRQGEYVAMTGDGVNDAPALRRANIGVAMGRCGTDVAREASHMVLLDDNFATIVKAVREGRRIYDNIRRFVRYILSTNSGEIWTLFLAPFLGLPLPLLPIHILWMNLVTDGLPGVALAAEPPERAVMRRPPRSPAESIFAHGLWQHAVWVGLLMAALALGTQAWAIHNNNPHWQSMTFSVLTLAQLAHVLAIRSERESLFTQGLWSNRLLFGAVVLTFGMLVSTLYVPGMRSVFNTQPLTITELFACVGVASIVFFAVEMEKWTIRRARPIR
jgi:Ca2+-transporting ATPase